MSEQTLPQSRATAEQLLARLLDLAISCRSIRDATVERVSSAFDVDLVRRPDGTFAGTERLTASWWYLLHLAPHCAAGPRLSFSLLDNDGGHSGPMTAVCAMDLDQLTSTLEEADFTYTDLYAEHGRRSGRLFHRGDLRVEALTRGESADPQAITRRCIWSVQLT